MKIGENPPVNNRKPAVTGRRVPRGRVIAGNFNRYPGYTPPQAKTGYADFGLDDEPSLAYQSVRERQHEADLPSLLKNSLHVAVPALFMQIFFATLYWILSEGLRKEFPILNWSVLVSVLVLLGAIKSVSMCRRLARRKEASASVQAVASVFSVLGWGGLFYGFAVMSGLYSVFAFADVLPMELVEVLSVLDMGLIQVFSIFREGAYVVIPAVGGLIGWVRSGSA